MGLDFFQWRASIWISVNRLPFCLLPEIPTGLSTTWASPWRAPHAWGLIPVFGMEAPWRWPSPAPQPHLLLLPAILHLCSGNNDALQLRSLDGSWFCLQLRLSPGIYSAPQIQVIAVSWAVFCWWCFCCWFLCCTETLGWDGQWSWNAASLHSPSPVHWSEAASLGLGEGDTFSNSSTPRGHILLVCTKTPCWWLLWVSFPPSSPPGIPAYYHLRQSASFWPPTVRSSLPSVAQPEWVCVFKLPPQPLHAFMMAAFSVNCN